MLLAKCGIRQHSHLSAVLFIITVETLSLSLKNNKSVQGIKIGNEEFNITQLADDTTLLLNNVCSLQQALNILCIFEKVSGLKLNVSKSEVLQIGKPIITNRNPFHLKWDKYRIYALGTWFYKDYKNSINHTYSRK